MHVLVACVVALACISGSTANTPLVIWHGMGNSHLEVPKSLSDLLLSYY